MKNLLKYLIPILVIAAFSCVAGRSDTSSQDIRFCDFSTEETVLTSSVSTPDSDISSPRRIATGTNHLKRQVRRTASTQPRLIIEIVKSGKVSNPSVVYSVQKKSLITNTLVADHANKLVCLGKLII